jgi:hypothetical protein
MNKEQYRCAFCGCKTSIADFGERHVNDTWWCFEHTEKLWESLSKNIKNTSDYWDYLEKKGYGSPRPKIK